MKKNNIFKIVIGILLLIVAACDPIAERDVLVNSFDPDQIELEAIQSTTGGNGITLKMNTPGVTGYWDYNIDQAFTDRVGFNYPIPGKATFTFHVSTPYMPNGNPAETEQISKSIDVQIDVLDQPLPKEYYSLVGDNLEGKTWVFSGVPNDNTNWWYMCQPDDPTSWEGVWWNAGGTCCPPSDASGEMTFDLDGAANFTYLESAGGTPVTGGGFSFSPDFSKLFIKGEKKILGNEEPRGNPDGEYVIIRLNADELILYVPNNEGGTGWTWVFKPKA